MSTHIAITYFKTCIKTGNKKLHVYLYTCGYTMLYVNNQDHFYIQTFWWFMCGGDLQGLHVPQILFAFSQGIIAVCTHSLHKIVLWIMFLYICGLLFPACKKVAMESSILSLAMIKMFFINKDLLWNTVIIYLVSQLSREKINRQKTTKVNYLKCHFKCRAFILKKKHHKLPKVAGNRLKNIYQIKLGKQKTNRLVTNWKPGVH